MIFDSSYYDVEAPPAEYTTTSPEDVATFLENVAGILRNPDSRQRVIDTMLYAKLDFRVSSDTASIHHTWTHPELLS